MLKGRRFLRQQYHDAPCATPDPTYTPMYMGWGNFIENAVWNPEIQALLGFSRPEKIEWFLLLQMLSVRPNFLFRDSFGDLVCSRVLKSQKSD